MTLNTLQQQHSQHGVLMSVDDQGILIIGEAGVGKSSFALELLYQGYQLIADDVVDLHIIDDQLYGRCPPLLENLLHSRELGLISIPTVFDHSAWQAQHKIDYIVKLQTTFSTDHSLIKKTPTFSLLGHALPLLTLTVQSPATLTHRLLCWLSIQSSQASTGTEFKQRQQLVMASS